VTLPAVICFWVSILAVRWCFLEEYPVWGLIGFKLTLATLVGPNLAAIKTTCAATVHQGQFLIFHCVCSVITIVIPNLSE